MNQQETVSSERMMGGVLNVETEWWTDLRIRQKIGTDNG